MSPFLSVQDPFAQYWISPDLQLGSAQFQKQDQAYDAGIQRVMARRNDIDRVFREKREEYIV